ncbi:MAG: endonuclease/exonuclease/phosphatase family protein [Prolixibacteraceae bacterium]
MKKLIGLIIILLPCTLMAQQMNIIAFNIRYNNPGDGENAWPNRKEMVTGLLQFHDPDIFGLQEALHGQIEFIDEELPKYDWFGVGRDDGETAGEFCPIFYRTDKFILLEKGNFWLSETPEKPSLGWDAAIKRIVTWGKFQSKVTGKQFIVFNTHFDHVGVEARKNSAKLIRERIEEMTEGVNLPVIVTGDFNLTPDEEPVKMLKEYLSDTRDVTKEPPYGPEGTFSGFDFCADLTRRIDYIFVRGKIEVLEYAALSDSKDQRYPSDHLPVFARVQLK